MTPQKDRRLYRNFFLEPLSQTRLALSFLCLGLAFSICMIYLMFKSFETLHTSCTQLPQWNEELNWIFDQVREAAYLWSFFLVSLYALSTFFLGIIQTHRFVGPAWAASRYIKHLLRGKYDEKLTLRKGDGLPHLAADLNRLAEHLAANQGKIIPLFDDEDSFFTENSNNYNQ